MFGLGLPELLIILVIVVLLFGAGRLPQIGAGIGEGDVVNVVGTSTCIMAIGENIRPTGPSSGSTWLK